MAKSFLWFAPKLWLPDDTNPPYAHYILLIRRTTGAAGGPSVTVPLLFAPSQRTTPDSERPTSRSNSPQR